MTEPLSLSARTNVRRLTCKPARGMSVKRACQSGTHTHVRRLICMFVRHARVYAVADLHNPQAHTYTHMWRLTRMSVIHGGNRPHVCVCVCVFVCGFVPEQRAYCVSRSGAAATQQQTCVCGTAWGASRQSVAGCVQICLVPQRQHKLFSPRALEAKHC